MKPSLKTPFDKIHNINIKLLGSGLYRVKTYLHLGYPKGGGKFCSLWERKELSTLKSSFKLLDLQGWIHGSGSSDFFATPFAIVDPSHELSPFDRDLLLDPGQRGCSRWLVQGWSQATGTSPWMSDEPLLTNRTSARRIAITRRGASSTLLVWAYNWR